MFRCGCHNISFVIFFDFLECYEFSKNPKHRKYFGIFGVVVKQAVILNIGFGFYVFNSYMVIAVEDVMEELNFGPNGALLYCMALALGLVELARGYFVLRRAMEGVHGDFCDDVHLGLRIESHMHAAKVC